MCSPRLRLRPSPLIYCIGSHAPDKGVDTCTSNVVYGNVIGPGVTAELVEIKEHSTGNVVEGNMLDGSALCGKNGADSWCA